jgi:hypothetical protein
MERLDAKKLNRRERSEEFKNTLYPFRHMNRYMGPDELRNSIANVKSHLALTSAIMCGVSSASLLVWIGHPELPFHEIADTGLAFSSFVCPLYTMSFFFSLQSLMSAFLVTGYLHATPIRYSAKFAEKHARIIAFAGWLKVPSLVTLGLGMILNVFLQFYVYSLGVVCHIGATLGFNAAVFAASCYTIMGLITIVQLHLFSRSHIALRKDFENEGS